MTVFSDAKRVIEDIVKVLTTIKVAAEAGELDAQI